MGASACMEHFTMSQPVTVAVRRVRCSEGAGAEMPRGRICGVDAGIQRRRFTVEAAPLCGVGGRDVLA
jgi:hypothetical protein